MIFAGIVHDLKSEVYFVDEQFNKDACDQKPGRKFILWQVNASVHKAKVVIKKLKELQIETIGPPPLSPDINVNENWWKDLALRVYD